MTDAINKAELVCPTKLDIYGTILVSISGGSDSDIVMDLVERHKGSADVKYVWFDTGLEYEATKKHLPYLEKRYGVEIEKMKAVVPIPTSCSTYGIPFLTKIVSEYIERLQRHGFQWENLPFDELYKKYPKCKAALRWWCNAFGEKSRRNINRHKWLKEFMVENPPTAKFSPKCCDGAKKKPLKKAIKLTSAKLSINGMRRAEGGARSSSISTCFSVANDKHIDEYRPIFFFSDADKREYENTYFMYELIIYTETGTESRWYKNKSEARMQKLRAAHSEKCKKVVLDRHGIVHSECYTSYGMKRTGCAGCPFGSRFEAELETIKHHEPKLYNAVISIFGKSYEYTRKYREYKEKRTAEIKSGNIHGQSVLF